ncbi:MAG: diguanylate cyclase [Chloroflexota bacterium]|nr:diguanylate cyclase [Chloroflexota bacterium]
MVPSSIRGPARSWPWGSVWLGLVPYALLPPAGVLGLQAWRSQSTGALRLGVSIGAVGLVAIVVVFHRLALADTRRLHRIRTVAAERLARLNADLTVANARLGELAVTDSLTGVANHRATVEAVDHEIERAERYAHPFALLVLDVDHFKAVNDAYGHAAGDESLRELCEVVEGCLRSGDTLGRWGGEEFIIVMPELVGHDAFAAAERVRAAVDRHRFGSGGGSHLTCSIGLACYPTDATGRDQLIALADGALYTAKRLGRNKVCSAIGSRLLPPMPALAPRDGHRTGDGRADAALTGTVEALVSLVAARDRYTGQHTQDVGSLALRVALALGMTAPEARMIGLAGRLHDIGKVAVPDAVLQKAGSLSAAEWGVVRTHSAVGADILSEIPALRPVAPLVRGHHERWDGTGYPDRLAGETIPLGARVLAVVDAFEAITTERPYQPAHSIAWALTELHRGRGKQFDPIVVDALDEVLAADPTTPRRTPPEVHRSEPRPQFAQRGAGEGQDRPVGGDPVTLWSIDHHKGVPDQGGSGRRT